MIRLREELPCCPADREYHIHCAGTLKYTILFCVLSHKSVSRVVRLSPVSNQQWPSIERTDMLIVSLDVAFDVANELADGFE